MVSNIRVSIFNFPYNYKNRVLACFQTRPGRPLMASKLFSGGELDLLLPFLEKGNVQQDYFKCLGFRKLNRFLFQGVYSMALTL